MFQPAHGLFQILHLNQNLNQNQVPNLTTTIGGLRNAAYCGARESLCPPAPPPEALT